MTFESALSQYFPGTVPDRFFLSKTREKLGALGFYRDNSIACVGVCRDEITRPFVRLVEEAWGEAFNFSSLAGMLFLGKTGMRAAQHHAPSNDDRPRFVYFAFAHIGISEDGTPGKYLRVGQKEPSPACGALSSLVGKLDRESYNLDVDVSDIELSLLKWKLVHLGENEDFQHIVPLTRLTYAIIVADLKDLIRRVEEQENSGLSNDYAVLAGIQIHAPNGRDYIWPGEMFARVSDKIKEISLSR